MRTQGKSFYQNLSLSRRRGDYVDRVFHQSIVVRTGTASPITNDAKEKAIQKSYRRRVKFHSKLMGTAKEKELRAIKYKITIE